MMKHGRLLAIIVGIFILALAIRYVYNNLNSFSRILDITVGNICVFILLQIISLSINGCILVVLLKAFDTDLPYADGFRLASMNTFLNYLVLKGGIFANGYFLKKVHRLSYTDFIVSMWVFMLINIMMSGAAGIVFLTVQYMTTGRFSAFLFLIFLFLSITVFVMMRLSTRGVVSDKSTWPLVRKLNVALNSWKTLHRRNGVIFWLLMLIFLNFIIYAFRLKYGFHILFNGMPFAGCMIISIVGILSTLVSFTPGALGIREFLIGTTYSLIDGDMVNAIVVAALDRAISIFVVFTLGIISCIYYLRQSNKAVRSSTTNELENRITQKRRN